jgi:hypothetical protein
MKIELAQGKHTAILVFIMTVSASPDRISVDVPVPESIFAG